MIGIKKSMKTIKPLNLKIIGSDLEALATASGIIVVLITPKGVMDPLARRINKLTRGSITRLIGSKPVSYTHLTLPTNREV